jgi:outer membrane protein TolC
MISFKTVVGGIRLSILLFATGTSIVFAESTSSTVASMRDVVTLAECIRIAVKENRTIKSAYLDRIVQKYELRIAEDKFYPKMQFTTGVQRSNSSNTSGITSTDFSTTVNETLPTGATVNLTARHDFNSTGSSSSNHSYGWNASLNQPLLKGGGFDVSTASVRTARINEQGNILSLKSTIMDTLTSVITVYRSYVQAIKTLEISRQSLERGKELVAINKELIAAGRMAQIDIIQSEADVANRDFNLLASENSVEAARLELVKILDIDKNRRFIPVENFIIEPIPFDLEQAKKLAFENRPDFQSALLGLEIANLNLMVAKNSTMWDLALTAGYGQDYLRDGLSGTNGYSDKWNTGLKLTIPFWDLTVEQGCLNARVALRKNENSMAKLKQSLEIEVQDGIRNAETNLRQVKLAQLSRELTQKKVEIETDKLKVGRSTNFQLVSFQNDLVNAQNNELNSIISYLNALTILERTLGITLDKWGVLIAERNGEQI